jgi:hypothetical protein
MGRGEGNSCRYSVPGKVGCHLISKAPRSTLTEGQNLDFSWMCMPDIYSVDLLLLQLIYS